MKVRKKSLNMAILFIIIGLFLHLILILQIVPTDNPVQLGDNLIWLGQYLYSVASGFGALGLFFGAISVIPPRKHKFNLGSKLLIINGILIVFPFIMINLWMGIEAFGLFAQLL